MPAAASRAWRDIDTSTCSLPNRGEIPDWAFTLVDTINNVLPRYKDLDRLTSKLIASGTLTDGESRMFGIAQLDYPSWTATFGVSLVFIAVMLALSCWRFSKRDY